MVMTNRLRTRICTLARAKKLNSPTALSKASGLTRPDCSNILSGKKKDITTGTLEKLAKALGCTVELLEKVSKK